MRGVRQGVKPRWVLFKGAGLSLLKVCKTKGLVAAVVVGSHCMWQTEAISFPPIILRNITRKIH